MTVAEGRKRLDKTLASPALTDTATVRNLVYSQLLRSSPVFPDGKGDLARADLGKPPIEAIDTYSSEVWGFLEALRSTAGDHFGKLSEGEEDHGGWKLKEETSRFRVMYREGSEGTPIHTLCLEGILEGHIPNALCVSWEAPLFREWWPQFSFPSFKILESKWVRRIRVGQDLAALRFKVPWPFAQREVVFSLFELEYFQEDLIFVLMHSVPPTDRIEEKAYGFSVTDIPPTPHSVVRMDLGGGFVLQRMASGVSYFRTIMNLDMKLDIVPPWVINFMSRQLAGQGYKLFQKAVLQVDTGMGGKSFQQLVKTEPLYERVRQALESAEKYEFGNLNVAAERVPAVKESTRDKGKSLQGSLRRLGSAENYRVAPLPEAQPPIAQPDPVVTDPVSTVPVKLADSGAIEPASSRSPMSPPSAQRLVSSIPESDQGSSATNPPVDDATDPEVKWALQVLEKVIAYVRQHGAGSLPFLQPREEPSSVEERQQDQPSIQVEGISDSPASQLKMTGENVASRGPELVKVEAKPGKVEAKPAKVETKSVKVESKPSSPRRKGRILRTDSGPQHPRRWSMFKCLPTRLSRRPPLLIDGPPEEGGKMPEQTSPTLPRSPNTGDIVSLGDLCIRETNKN